MLVTLSAGRIGNRSGDMTHKKSIVIGVPVEICIDAMEGRGDIMVDRIVGNVSAVVWDSEGTPYWVIDAVSVHPDSPGRATCFLVGAKAVGVTLEWAYMMKKVVAVAVGEVTDRSVSIPEYSTRRK